MNTLEGNLENSHLDLSNNLSLSTDFVTEEKEPIRRSNRLTKTNPIVRYNNPGCHDYRKHRKKTELGGHTESTRSSTGEGRQQPLDQLIANRNMQDCQERLTVRQTLDQWRNDSHNRKQNVPVGRSRVISRRGNVGDRRTHLAFRN